MKRAQGGFSLLEGVLALVIGLGLLAAASQLFVSAHETWRLQGVAARLQDDARLALQRMAQDIRMAGMFGCLRLQPGDFNDPEALQAFARPLHVSPTSLSLVVAELPGHSGAPGWTLLTNCTDEAHVYKGRAESSGQLLAFPISRHVYALEDGTLKFRRRGTPQPLVDHVREMRVAFVETPQGGRVDVHLTLYEPTLRIEQQHALSVALRNPVPEP
ncbi:pilus assembly protein PilW [Pseudomonas sp. PAGU 2196]|uniref:PilW family protein n=1 Tax=Pseudomonas sp. PAGU 2196 TaxID=2793997 RepID=UPI001EDD0558|nr:pilus assembly protein PilW [Pseudomonas sp. PAGU 2196]GHS83179.1 pilus assembly protein PilW [Pseudomonas sp. PAGU 2196]